MVGVYLASLKVYLSLLVIPAAAVHVLPSAATPLASNKRILEEHESAIFPDCNDRLAAAPGCVSPFLGPMGNKIHPAFLHLLLGTRLRQ